MIRTQRVDVRSIALTVACEECLNPDELARASRFRFEHDRLRWSRARAALRRVLAAYAGVLPAELCFATGQHGKPFLPAFPQLEFNLSHAADWAMIAVSHGVPVGIDIERIRPELDMKPLLERLGETDLPSDSRDLFARWTLREARSKAVGGALFDSPPESACGIALVAPEGYAAAVAAVGFIPEPRYCE